MLKNIAKLEHKIGDRSYQLLCDQDSPLHEVKESLIQFMGFAVKMEEAAKASAVPATPAADVTAVNPIVETPAVTEGS